VSTADSGNINSDPPKKNTPPTRVKLTETVTLSNEDGAGGTKAKKADAIKAIQPSKLIVTTHHESLAGFQTQ
jgi:hypothetical protein